MQIRFPFFTQTFQTFLTLCSLSVLLGSCRPSGSQPNIEAPYCEPSLFCWTNMPQGHTLNAIWGTKADDIWAAGEQGTVLHYNGKTWGVVPLQAPTTTSIQAIWGSSPTDVWFAGDNGRILQYSEPDKSLKVVYQDPAHQNLHAIHGSGPEDIWFVGDKGTLLHLNAQGWTKTTIDAAFHDFTFTAVWASSPNDVWIGYLNVAKSTSGILHYDGQSMQQSFEVPPLGNIQALIRTIGKTSSDQLLAIGGDLVLTYDGAAWSIEETHLGGFSSIWNNGGENIWGTDNIGQIRSYSRSTKADWSLQGTNLVGVGVNAIWGSSDNNLWAVGAGGTLLHIVNRQIELTTSVRPQIFINDLFGTASNNLWAVGDSALVLNQAAIWHYDGTSWAPQSLSPSVHHLNRIWGSDAQHIWAVGGFPGTILFYDGTKWQDAPVDAQLAQVLSGFDLTALGGADATHVFAGSESSAGKRTLLEFDSSGAWHEVKSLDTGDLWVATANRVWVVGGTSIELFDTGTVTAIAMPANIFLGDLSVSGVTTDPNHVWVVGRNIMGGPGPNYVLLNCDAGSKMCTKPSLNDLWPGASVLSSLTNTRIWVRSNNDIVVQVGEQVTHWDGKAWAVLVSGVSINGFWSNPAGTDQWLAGFYTALLHYQAP